MILEFAPTSFARKARQLLRFWPSNSYLAYAGIGFKLNQRG
jgi:hypothetical protein